MTTLKNGRRSAEESLALIRPLLNRPDTTFETLMHALNRSATAVHAILDTHGLPTPPRASTKAREDAQAVGYQPWRDQAACAGADLHEFFPTEYTPAHVERVNAQWCSTCPVRDDCLAETLARENGCAENTRAGIYGGTTPRQRTLMQRGVA